MDENPLLTATLPQGSKKPLSKRKGTKKNPRGSAGKTKQDTSSQNSTASSPNISIVNSPEIPLATPDDREVLFKPNPGPQTFFLASSEREVLYGGAAGGGKS